MTLRVETIEFGFQGERSIKNYNQLKRVKAMLMNIPEPNLQETPATTRLLDFFRPDSVFIYTTDGSTIYGYIMFQHHPENSPYIVRKWSNKNKESETLLSDAGYAYMDKHKVGGRPRKVRRSRRYTKKTQVI